MDTSEHAFRRLGTVPLLRALPPERLRAISDAARLIPISRGEPAVPGDAGWVGVVQSGSVRTVSWTAAGRRALLWLSAPGESFGELALFASPQPGGPRAEAADASWIWQLPATPVRQALDAEPAAAREAAALLAERLRSMTMAVEDAVARDLSERLVRRLCDLGERFGAPDTQGATVLTTRLTHQDLADMVGASREAVTRTLADLRRHGWLVVRRGRHLIADLEALRAQAGLA